MRVNTVDIAKVGMAASEKRMDKGINKRYLTDNWHSWTRAAEKRPKFGQSHYCKYTNSRYALVFAHWLI